MSQELRKRVEALLEPAGLLENLDWCWVSDASSLYDDPSEVTVTINSLWAGPRTPVGAGMLELGFELMPTPRELSWTYRWEGSER